MSPARLHEGVACLSRGTYFREASLDMTLSILTESAADISGVARVSIWAFSDRQRELRCIERYEKRTGAHTSGEVLLAERCPGYFRALQSGEAIAADDAYLHPATAELASDYLDRHQVTARLETPIHIRGELQGVFTLEQVATHYPWTTAHHLFAQSVANLVSLALVEYEAGEARRKAQLASERMRAIFDAARDAMLLADGGSGLIIDANRRAEVLFGCLREALIGRHQRMLHPPAIRERMAEEFSRLLAGGGDWPVRSMILRTDGREIPVEIAAELSELSDGRKLVFGIFRPVQPSTAATSPESSSTSC